MIQHRCCAATHQDDESCTNDSPAPWSSGGHSAIQTHTQLSSLLCRDTSETDDAWTEERLKALEEDRVAVERMWGEHAQETDIGVLKFKIVSRAVGLCCASSAVAEHAGGP